MSDLALLRAHEPVLRFTAGELFYPCAVDGYVHECSLWVREHNGRSRMLAQRCTLDLDSLATHGATTPEPLYLRFVERPLSAREYQKWLLRPRRVRFHAPGRLARVPPWSRLLDSAFDLSLVIRGRVPGGTTAAAEVQYTALHARDERRVYYGRVLRVGGWTVLNYLFFYAMNDWRSTFHGANDHEADWEQIFVYLYETDEGVLEPRWVAFASHDYDGDDLRRRWDDPMLVKDGLHPVVFAAAGSHSSYFECGEYLMGVEPRFLAPVKRAGRALRRFWTERLKQGQFDEVSSAAEAVVNVPFVDYARGDGLIIGPGGHEQWTPIVISDDVPWVSEYRGLWGLDTNDPFGGERAPAGPKYERAGSVRLSWYDPLGFAGLNKVVIPPRLVPDLERRQHVLEHEADDLESQIKTQRCATQILALDEEALRATAYMSTLHKHKGVELAAAEEKLRALKERHNQVTETRESVERYVIRVHAGLGDGPRAHLKHIRRPDATPVPRRLLQVWAALSGAIALLAVGLLLVVFPPHWWLWAIALGLGYATIEAGAESRLIDFLLSVAVVLAAISALILAWEFWRVLLVIALAIAIALMIRDNVRELRGT
jgi:hypothetical protein